MAVACITSLVESLTQLQLLAPAQLEEVTASLQTRFADPRDLSRELLKRDWLTAYQVNQLLVGRGAELLLGQYVLQERLGEGGMGQVFKARHRTLGRVVAVKVLRPQLLNNPTAVKRFRREVQTSGQLDHPNIVRALDADEVNGVCYFVMEYVEGVDLAKLIKQQGPLPVAQACDYIRQAALGLQHALERGMVHRDIKPHNLLMSPPAPKAPSSGSSALLPRPTTCLGRWGTVKILDMGLARLKERDDAPGSSLLTQLGSVMGTPDFIAPEQARNPHASDIRADLYSLGCTFYFLLSGEVPFPNGTFTEKLLQHQLDEPRPVEDVRRLRLLGDTPVGIGKADNRGQEIPGRVTALVRNLLAKCPEHRPQTPAEVAEALEAMLLKAASSSSRRLRRDAVNVPAAVVAEAAWWAEAATPESEQVTPPAEGITPPLIIAPPPAMALGAVPVAPRRHAGRSFTRVRRALVVAGIFLSCLLALRWLPADRSSPPVVEPEPAEAAWEAIARKAENKSGVKTQDLQRDILAYRREYPGVHVDRVAALLARLPSPLDKLDASGIPLMQRLAWQPKELVAVFGERRENGKEPALAVAIAPDGERVAGGWINNVVKVWTMGGETPHAEEDLNAHTGQVTAVAFGPDGRVLASAGNDGLVVVWDGLRKPRKTRLEGHDRPVRALAFSPRGDTLASGSFDGTVRLWDPVTARSRVVLPREAAAGSVTSVAFSPDGTLLACGRENGTLTLIPLGQSANLQSLTSTRPHTRPVLVVAFSPDGQRLVSGGADPTLRIADKTPGGFTEKALLKCPGPVSCAAFSPDGKTLVSAGWDGSLVLWDVTSGAKIREWALRWPIRGVAFAPDGRHIATANNNGTLYMLRLTPSASPATMAVAQVRP